MKLILKMEMWRGDNGEPDEPFIKTYFPNEFVLMAGIGYVFPLIIPTYIFDKLKESKVRPMFPEDIETIELLMIQDKPSLFVKAKKTRVYSPSRCLVMFTGSGLNDVVLPNNKTSSDLTDEIYSLHYDLIQYWKDKDETPEELLKSYTFSLFAEMDGCGSRHPLEYRPYSCDEYIIDNISYGQGYYLPNTIADMDGAFHEGWFSYISDREDKSE